MFSVALIGLVLFLVLPAERSGGVNIRRAREVSEAKLKGVAYLENGENTKAAAVFEPLGEQLPKELLPKRNLAIAKLLHFEQVADSASAVEAKQALDELVQFEGRSPESLWLYVQLMRHPQASTPTAERDLELQRLLSEAIESDSANPAYWFAVYEIGRGSTSEEAIENGNIALIQTRELAPRNLWVLAELLSVQAKSEDPKLKETLQEARDVLAPLEASIQRESRLSIAEHLDAAEQALQAGDWREVYRKVFRLRNAVSYSELSKLDHSRVSLHPLEFVALDFSDDIPTTVRPNGGETDLIDFQFQPQALDVEVDAVVDVALADFDLDGEVDLLAITNDQLLIMTQSDGEWELALELAVPAGARGILLADLDRDRIVLKKSANGAAQVERPPSLEEVASQPTVETNGAAETPESLEAAKQVPLEMPANDPPPAAACHEADLDLLIYGDFGVLVFRNTSTDGGDVGVELIAQPESLAELKEVRTAALADVDHDSDVDLVLGAADGVHVWWLTGPSLVFEDGTQWSALPQPPLLVRKMAIVDWDRDADIDVIVSTEEDRIGLLENRRHGRFTYRELGQGNWLGGDLSIVDCDGDAAWDILVSGASGSVRLPSVVSVTGRVSELAPVLIHSNSVAGAIAEDFDNNAAVDILAWSDGGFQVFRGLLDGSFQSGPSTTAAGDVACGAAADWDADGDLDVLLGTSAGLQMFRNEGAPQNAWLTLEAKGTADNAGRANHTGIGSLVELKSAGRYQARVVTSQQTHFGLGTHSTPDVIRIIWPNGVPQGVISPPTNLTLCEPLRLSGSCPYLYTWNGERFVFHTDCLWAAPIGMQVADGVSAPSRAWEYLKIPGERLAPTSDGRYRLQLTEELWEVAYFDQLELLAVDHPAGVDIYSNEKVGPAEFASYQLHTVAAPHAPVSATDQSGQDVSSLLAQRDDNYLQAFQGRLRQGLTEPHYIELDLGPLDQREGWENAPQRIKLFLTGWIYPTDTSLNVGFSRDPDTDGPRFPSVWTPGADGVWRERMPFMGFPGGKTKTIAVDLSDAFEGNDFRVRVATTGEIYWDQAFFTVDDPEVDLKVQTLQPTQADLHFRGVSTVRWHKPNAPERFDYDEVNKEPVWPPIRGAFTRYGDVVELLTASDNQLVVLGAGDEMTVDFQAPPPPPAGWKRDFILHCVGWDKDANLNTFQGQSVEPLPVLDMTDYGAHNAPDAPGYQSYLQRYQTRRHSYGRFWRWTKDYPRSPR